MNRGRLLVAWAAARVMLSAARLLTWALRAPIDADLDTLAGQMASWRAALAPGPRYYPPKDPPSSHPVN